MQKQQTLHKTKIKGKVVPMSKRPLAGRLDAHEQQADAAAMQFVRGDVQGLARRLTPAPAAGFNLATSTGRPLDGSIRADLEHAFSARLDAVRIHTNAVADAAARAAGSEAFVSGRDIYFAAGNYDPGHEPGRRLLAHEVAHVLQQTGRPAADGRLRAGDLRGSGQVQCALSDAFVDTATITALTDQQVIDLHGSLPSATSTFTAAYLSALKKDPKQAVADLVSRTFPTKPGNLQSEPLETRMVAIDLLKRHGEWASALVLIGSSLGGAPLAMHPDYRTVLPSKEFYNTWAASTNTTMVLFKIWKEHKFFTDKQVGPKRQIQTLRQYFLGPTLYDKPLAVPELDTEYATQMKQLANLKAGLATPGTTGLVPVQSEFYLAVLQAVHELDGLRKDILTAAEKDAAQFAADFKRQGPDRVVLPASHRANTAMRFNQRINDVLANKAGTPALSWEVRFFLSEPTEQLGVRMKMVSKQAHLFWTAILAFFDKGNIVPDEKLKLDFAGPKEKNKAEIFAALVASEAGKSLEQVLLGWFGKSGLLKLDELGDLPNPETYLLRRDQAVAELQALSGKKLDFQQALINLFKEELALRDPAKMNLALALGFAVMLVDWLVVWLQQYDHAADKSNVAMQDKVKQSLVAAGDTTKNPYGADDIRILHRNQMADRLLQITLFVRWPAIATKAAEIRGARSASGDYNRLALKGNWEVDASARMDRIISDFGSSFQVEGWEPFTIGDVYTFFHMIYHRTFAKAIDELMAAEQKAGVNLQDPKRKSLMQQAYQKAEAIDMPVRWQVKDFDYNLRRPTVPGMSSWGELILGHYKTLLLINDLEKRHKKFIVPKFKEGVFLWIIPPVPELIAKLRNELKLPEAYKDKEKLHWFEWWKWISQEADFTRLLGIPLSSSYDTDVDRFRQQLRSQDTATNAALTEASRRASTHERTIADVRVANLLTAFNPAGRAVDKVTPKGFSEMFNLEVPDKILLEMDDFVFKNSYPYDDWPYHLAAMLLENAALFESKLNPASNKSSMGKQQGVGLAVTFLSRVNFALEISADAATMAAAMPKADAAELQKRRGEFRAVLREDWRKDPTHLKNARQKLTALVRGLQTSLKDVQTSDGIQGYKSQSASAQTAGNPDLQGYVRTIGVGSGNKIPAGDNNENDILIDGQTWRLIEVRADFTYHPPVTLKTAGRKATAGGPEGESVLIVNGTKLTDAKQRHVPLLVLNLEGSDSNRVIYGDDDAMLSRFTYVAQMWGVVKGLENTAAVIKQGFTFLLEMAEFAPGPGWIVMAVRMFSGIMAFMQAADFKDLVAVVQGLPAKLPEFIKEKLGKINAASIIEFLLFADTTALAGLVPAEPKEAPKKPAKKGRLSRFVENLTRLGGLFLAGLAHVQTRVRHKTDQVGLFLMSHPTIAWAAGWALENIDRLRANEILENPPGKKEILEVKDMFENTIPGFLDGLGEIQLPKELIPLEAVVEALIELAVKSLGKKAELVAEGLLYGLKYAPGKLYDRMVAAVTEQLRTNVDPNVLWRDAVNAHGNRVVNEAYELFRVEYNAFFKGISLLNVKEIGAKRLSISLVKEMDAASPAFSSAGMPSRLPAVAPELPRGGLPLEPATRRDTERRFGHDLGHVRLHRGASTAALASGLGVDGLTSGSNIYLRPGLTPDSGAGARVFHHEVTHVLQQTGPRPLGGRYSTASQRGTPGMGLRYHPGQEAEADRVAGQVAQGPARRPVKVGPGGGMQPSALLTRLFDRLVSFSDLEDTAEHHEQKSKPGTLPRGLVTAVNKVATGIYEDVYKVINGSSVTFDKPFDKAKQEIRTHLNKSEFIQNLDLVLPRLALDAQIEGPRPKGETPAGKPKPKPKLLDHMVFRDNLTRYIFARSGVLLQIGLKKKNKDGEAQVIDVLSVNVEYIHLTPLHGNHKFWTMALDGVVAPADRAKMLPRIRAYLLAKGPSSGIWVKNEFRLNKKVVKETEAFMAAGDTKLLDPSLLPPKKEYLKKDGPTANIGLRLGLHTAPNQTGTERESHHITQYLLLEYFANKSNNLAFPLLKKQKNNKYLGMDVYPGLAMAGSDLGSFDKITINDLEKHESGKRGAAMPAILLAKSTHRNGNLHIKVSDDFPGKTISSQGEGVHSVFTEALDTADAKYLPAQKNVQDFRKYTASKPNVSKIIFNAMQQTYKWMRGRMQPRLLTALKSVERAYYNDLAGEAKISDRISTDEMKTVHNNAVKFNDDTLGAKGWTGKNK